MNPLSLLKIRKSPDKQAEMILEFSDWMGIPIEPHRITLDRLRSLLLDQIKLEEQ